MRTARRNWIAAFYWMGVSMTLSCFALVMAGNTGLFGRFEHRGVPLSWAFAGAALVAFLAVEACYTVFSGATEAEDRISPLSPELQAAESQS